MRDIRAVVTDLDGTVVDRGGQVSAATVRAASDLADRGIPLIVATARTSAWLSALEQLVSFVSVAVCCGGAVGWSPRARATLWRQVVPPEIVDRIAWFAGNGLPSAAIAAYDGERWRATVAFVTVGPPRRGPLEIVPLAEIAGHPACALTICHQGGGEELMRVLAAEPGPALSVEFSTGEVADIGPAGSDKAAGVTRALAEVGVGPAQAIAFGDALNDLPVFALCGGSVAVANAHPEVLAAATRVAACIHDDGFARTLGDLGLTSGWRAAEAPAGPGCACRLPPGDTAVSA